MDITLCTSQKCPVRDICFRSQAEPSPQQRYSNFEYTCHEENGFAYYIQMSLNKITQRGKEL